MDAQEIEQPPRRGRRKLRKTSVLLLLILLALLLLGAVVDGRQQLDARLLHRRAMFRGEVQSPLASGERLLLQPADNRLTGEEKQAWSL
jgi:hypothetical protein